MTATAPAPNAGIAASVAVRRFPYPYRAMLAVCSDLDETPSLDVYLEQLRFLNTAARTRIGDGVGLEVGNSLFFDMARGHVSYWNADERGRALIRRLIQSGHIDCLHSFGDLTTSRAMAQRALDELERHDCHFKVWVDHAVAPTNFGRDIMQGHGDEPEHPAYHADLTMAHGIEYVWRGRVTSVIGQDCPVSLRPTFRSRHGLASARTVAKELAKQCLARAGSRKYAAHALNQTLWPVRLRDGQSAWEFLRCNPHWAGVSAGDTGVGVAEVLDAPFLETLVEREGSCVLYTHLGKLGGGQEPFGTGAVAAFQRLQSFARDRILVTTTRRLLDHARAQATIRVVGEIREGQLCIQISRPPSNRHAPLDGLTIYADTKYPISIKVDGEAVDGLVLNAADQTGRTSVSLPWPALKFPELRD